jgi:hypothetical protein
MTWQPGGEPGEALVVGQQLGLRVLGQHPDGSGLLRAASSQSTRASSFRREVPATALLTKRTLAATSNCGVRAFAVLLSEFRQHPWLLMKRGSRRSLLAMHRQL